MGDARREGRFRANIGNAHALGCYHPHDGNMWLDDGDWISPAGFRPEMMVARLVILSHVYQ